MRPVPAHRARPCPARWSCTSSCALTRWLTEEREMMSRMKRRTALATIAAMTALVVAAWVATPRAQTAGERIGQVTFATSCGAAVQKPFERGVALLHSFWYIEAAKAFTAVTRSEEHTSELQSQSNLVCRLLLEKKKTNTHTQCYQSY